MVKIPDKNTLKDHNWYSPRGVAHFDGSAFAAPGRAVQQLGSSIAKLGSSLGGAIEAGQAQQDGIAKHEATNQFLDAETRISDYIKEQERNIPEDGAGHRDNINGFVEKTYRDVFKSVPEKYRPEFDTMMHRRHQYYDLNARDYQQKKNDEYVTNGINTGLAGNLAEIDEKPEGIDDSIAKGMLRIENSPLPRNRKDELIRKFGLEAERRHLEWRIKNADKTGESAEDIENDIRQRIRPLWEPKLGPRSEAPQMNERGEQIQMASAGGDGGRSMIDALPGSVQDKVAEKVQTGGSAYDIARSFVGKNEHDHAETLSAFFKKTSGQELNPADTAWCAAFVNATLAANGQKGTESLLARDFLKVGTAVDTPSQGDIVVLSRGNSSWQGHVGFYAGKDKNGNIRVLGGNQGDAVNISSYDASRVLGYRRPPSSGGEIPGGNVAKNVDATGFSVNLTAYSPQQGGDAMEGGYASSRKGPDGKSEVRTLSDVQSGRSKYVTVAGNPRDYGKEFTIPQISFFDRDGNKHSLENVRAVVHDTGSAFKNAPEGRFDVAIDRDASDKQMAASHDLWKKQGIKFISGSGTALAASAPDNAPLPGRKETSVADADTYGNAKGTQVADASGAVPSSAISARIKSRLTDSPGMVQPGNIDLDNRPVIRNDDGSISTESSFSVAIDGKEILLPSIIAGKRVTQKDAIAHYRRTGEHLGVFDSPEAATAYAKSLSQRQDGAYSNGLAGIGDDGKIRTLLDGIPDQTPLSDLPPDLRAQIEKMAPADAFKPRSVNGEKIAPADTITVGDVKNGLEAQLKSQAEQRVAQVAADKAVSEDRYGLAGRTPRHQYRWLTQPEADKLLRELSISQREKIKSHADALAKNIAEVGPDYPGLAEQEQKLMERARKYMLPNQISGFKIKLGIVKEVYTARATLRDMPADEVQGYLDQIKKRSADNKDPDLSASYIAAYQDARKYADDIAELRRKDSARSVAQSSEVMAVSQKLGEKMIESGYLSMGPDGKVTVNKQMKGSLEGVEANEAVVEARMTAQARIYGSRGDRRIKSITVDEARQLLNMDSDYKLDEADVMERLKAGAEKANATYGKYADRVFEDAVDIVLNRRDNRDQAATILKDVVKGRTISAETLHRYQLLNEMSGSEAFSLRAPDDLRSTQPYNYTLPVPSKYMSNGLRPQGGQPVPAQGGLPAMLQGGPNVTQGTPSNAWPGNQRQGGEPVQMGVPTAADIEALLSNPQQNAAAFTQKFGRQATEFVIQEAQKRAANPNRNIPPDVMQNWFKTTP